MFSAARPAPAELTREMKPPSTSWSSLSFAAIASACSRAIFESVASRITFRSPCLSRKSEIMSAGDAACAIAGVNKASDRKRCRAGFMCLGLSVWPWSSRPHVGQDSDAKMASKLLILLVGAAGFEPTTCSTQNCRATRLRYTPMKRCRYTLGPKPARHGRDQSPRLVAVEQGVADPVAGLDPVFLGGAGDHFEHALGKTIGRDDAGR